MTLRELGIPLKDIVGILQHRTPESVIALFSEQNKRIDNNIARLLKSKKLLTTLKSIIEDALDVDESKIEVRWVEEESIYLGPQIDYSTGKTIQEATHDFYKYCNDRDKNMDLNYPVWGVYSEERVKRGDWVGPDRFYFKMPDAPDKKPEGLYLIGYTRGDYGQNTHELYTKLLEYAKKHDLEICGPAYETYPLNEISIIDSHNYLIRISLTVKQR
jgi:DNA-binding transcriptional MerR regulator